ncbi:MAG: CopG family transcriptional regulator [Firmicutes bacterium]|nr:CopG family transcriptional regulator [Bacillota bacterium]
MVRTQVQLTEKQVKALKRLAVMENTSMAEIIRRSVDAYLESKQIVSDEEKITRAKAAVGRFHSGVGDISIRHDDYLGEDFR